MEQLNYTTVVRDFIIDNFLFGDSEKLKEDTSFLESGVIDSTGILEIINFMEAQFGIKVEDDELVPENFDSMINLFQFISKKVIKGKNS